MGYDGCCAFGIQNEGSLEKMKIADGTVSFRARAEKTLTFSLEETEEVNPTRRIFIYVGIDDPDKKTVKVVLQNNSKYICYLIQYI